jgi:succinoglycan biosynthesis protein ExoM
MPPKHHISVCICTYKRPELLRQLLSKLEEQETEGLFDYSIVIVDNDRSESARQIVESCARQSKVSISYYVEPEQNIALARNKAVENAKGNFIAFIDDDEFPVNTWLLNLYKTLLHYHADGTLGPVKPHYPDNTPIWLIKSKLCERGEHKTGSSIHWGQTRTGNTLLNKKLFDDKNFWFEPAYGRTGGEDTIFFKKHHENGKVFIWCNEAPVYEIVSTERWSKNFHVRKNLRIGCVVGENLRKQEGEFEYAGALANSGDGGYLRKQKALPQQFYILSKSAIWIISMTILFPFSFLLGQHLYMRCKTKLIYNYGVISGFLGYVMIRNRN